MATYDLKYPGAAIDAILDTAYDLQNAGYIFRGLASEYSNTPTERSWVLAGEGETGHGFTSPVPKGYIGVCVFNGTSWTGKLLKCVSIDSTPTNGSTNAVSSGGAYASISQLADTVNEALDNLTFTDTTPSAFLGNYIKMKVSTTDGGIERIMTYFTILAATAEKAGLLSAADKQKLDAILGNLRSLEIDDTTAYADLGTKIVESIKATIGGQEETISTFQLLAATASKAGLLSAADKAKLDAMLGNLRSLEIDDTTAYADLSDKIVESIKATIGGTEETISTFQILAATASKAGLLSAADKAKLDALWSSGYQFAGIATPSTTPVSTTSKIFYIATEAGTYFNAVTVTQGINILSWNGTSWSAVQVVGIDDEPTPGSNNLVKSGGVNGELRKTLNCIYSPTSLYNYNNIIGFINSSGEWNTESFHHVVVPLNGIDKLTLFLDSLVQGNGIIAFLRTYNIDEEYADFSSSYPSRIVLNAGVAVEYTVPSDANYLYIVTGTTSVSDLRSYITLVLRPIDNSVEKKTNEKLLHETSKGYAVVQGKAINSTTGEWINSSNYYTVCFEVRQKIISFEGATLYRAYFFSSSNVSADTYLGYTTLRADVPYEEAKYCVAIFSKESNPNGIGNLIIRQDADKMDIPRGFIIEKNKTISIDSASDPTNVYIANSTTLDLVLFKIEEGVTKIIPVGGVAGRYRFFNTYNKIDAESYIVTDDTNSGKVPDGARLACILFAHNDNPNGINNLVIKTEPDTVTISGVLANMMDKAVVDIDLSEVPDLGYIIGDNNKYGKVSSSLAQGGIVKLPPFASYLEIKANDNNPAVVALLKDNTVPSSKIPFYADEYPTRFKFGAGTTKRFKLNSSCKYLYFSKATRAGLNMIPDYVTADYSFESTNIEKKKLGILFIGSSGEQDMFAYVPPVLNEILNDYDITYGDMYYTGAQASDYVNFYKNNTPCTRVNYWEPGSNSWTTISGVANENGTIESVLNYAQWDLIVMKGTELGCRQLMRIIQNILTVNDNKHPVCFATVANIPRVYDNLWENVIAKTKDNCRKIGFVGWIPVCTAMQNARSNDVLKWSGSISCPEPTEFTIPGGKYLSFYHRVRAASSSIQIATIKATLIAGDGSVEIHATKAASESTPAIDDTLLVLTDDVEHSVNYNKNTDYIKIVNNGGQDCTVRFENTQANGDYMLFRDNQHTQSGIPALISAYTIVLKILEWTGADVKSINGSSFIPTGKNITKINAADAAGWASNLGHGYSCGIENYLGSDGNIYDRSQLTLFEDTLYVTTTVFNDTPDGNSVEAWLNYIGEDGNNYTIDNLVEINGKLYVASTVQGGIPDDNSVGAEEDINLINIYAAQEVAVMSVNYPDELIDCSGVDIDIPQKV